MMLTLVLIISIIYNTSRSQCARRGGGICEQHSDGGKKHPYASLWVMCSSNLLHKLDGVTEHIINCIKLNNYYSYTPYAPPTEGRWHNDYMYKCIRAVWAYLMLSAGGRVLYMYTTAMADLVGFSLVLLCGVFLPVRHALPSRGTYGTLSLAGSSSSGMVRIFIEGYAGGGSWGAVCYHDGFGMTEATVVCHQLGYTSASSYSSG